MSKARCLKNPQTGTINASFEPRAIGVQSFPFGTDQIIVFAVNTYERFSNAALGEYDISIDVNGDGKPDFMLFSADIGLIETGFNNGQIGSFLLNLVTGALFFESPADAPTDGSIVLMPVFASDMGICPANPRISYSVTAFDGSGSAGEAVPGTGCDRLHGRYGRQPVGRVGGGTAAARGLTNDAAPESRD